MRDRLPLPLTILLAGALAAGVLVSCAPAPAREQLPGAELPDQVDELEARLHRDAVLVARWEGTAILNDPALALGMPPARGAAAPAASAPSAAGVRESTEPRPAGARLKSADRQEFDHLPGAATDRRAGRSPRGGR